MSDSLGPLNLLAYNNLSFIDSPPADFQMFQWQSLVNHIANILDVPTVMINQANNKGMEVIATSKTSDNPYQSGVAIPRNVNIYCNKVVRENKSLYVKDATLDPEWHDNPELTQDNFNAYLGYPIKWPDGRVFGTICTMDKKAADYQQSFFELLETFKNIIEFELALIESNQKLQSLSLFEETTGLYNRRGMLEAARQMIGIANREKKQIGVLYVDINDLKIVNDKYGHDAGDELIRLCASALKTVLRVNDIAARMGGDEFVILALVDDHSNLEKLGKRFRSVVDKTSLSIEKETTRLSMSIGSATASLDTEDDLAQLIKQADKIMYQDKLTKKSRR